MGYDTIHETVIEDIVDIIKNGIDKLDNASPMSYSAGNIAKAGSITKASKGLIMEFPVLISKANHIESAGIVAKAYEAKFVTLLQLAFTACEITTSKSGLEFIRNFHTNLDEKTISVDKFIDVMDGYAAANESSIGPDSYALYKAVTEDMRNLCYHFDEDINESSLESYKILNNYGGLKVVKSINEVNQDAVDRMEEQLRRETEERKRREQEKAAKQDKAIKDMEDSLRREEEMKLRRQQTKDNTRKTDSQIAKNDFDKELDKLKYDRDTRAADIKNMQMQQNMITNFLVPSEIKKANELVPTMMIVNFIVDKGASGNIATQMIVGVKAKLYEVEPSDVINKIITKHVDSNILLKLIKVSTREISFVKDFLLAIDSAKLDALSRSKRGSTNKLFKVLERRALNGKIRKSLKMKDYAKAISSLVISQEEAEELMKNNIDVSNPKVIRPIMEKLNLISFAIIDETSESVRFIFDTGDDSYETIPLSKLEKEQKDGMSRKVINLMAKMNR